LELGFVSVEAGASAFVEVSDEAGALFDFSAFSELPVRRESVT
jgi:hypothetical protein